MQEIVDITGCRNENCIEQVCTCVDVSIGLVERVTLNQRMDKTRRNVDSDSH